RDPEHRGVDEEREAEVSGETLGGHARIVDEAALHHEPPEGALQSAEDEDAGETPRERPVDRAPRDEIKEGNEEGEADEASEQPVEVLPPEDALEALDRHVVV